MKDPDDLAGSPVVFRKGGELSIGRHFAARDRLDRFLSSGLELHRFPFWGNGYPFRPVSLFLASSTSGRPGSACADRSGNSTFSSGNRKLVLRCKV